MPRGHIGVVFFFIWFRRNIILWPQDIYFVQGNEILCKGQYYWEKKEEIWFSPITKEPTPTKKSKKQRDNTKNATKNIDYTTIADRLRTVSWDLFIVKMEMQMNVVRMNTTWLFCSPKYTREYRSRFVFLLSLCKYSNYFLNSNHIILISFKCSPNFCIIAQSQKDSAPVTFEIKIQSGEVQFCNLFWPNSRNKCLFTQVFFRILKPSMQLWLFIYFHFQTVMNNSTDRNNQLQHEGLLQNAKGKD